MMEKTTLNINDITFDVYHDGSVFGDGSHHSTQNVLELMSKQNFKNKTVMDIGTGTGVLSVFAKLSGASHVLAIDISSNSLDWARKNFKRNNVEVETEINSLTDYMDEKVDIILSNLPPAAQCENIKTVAKNLNQDGILIISWLNIIPLKDFNKDFEVIEHIKGKEYDAYVLRIKEK